MTFSQALLPEFDQEMAKTRTTLERLPEDRLDWRPHPKSPTLGWLATHVAQIPGWAVMVFEKEALDIAPPTGRLPQPPEAKSRPELLELFDRNASAARAAVAGATDEDFGKPWSLLSGGRMLFTLPRLVVLRGFVMNHTIHHRAQLGLYLRLNDLPVPAIYGPSADEAAF